MPRQNSLFRSFSGRVIGGVSCVGAVVAILYVVNHQPLRVRTAHVQSSVPAAVLVSNTLPEERISVPVGMAEAEAIAAEHERIRLSAANDLVLNAAVRQVGVGLEVSGLVSNGKAGGVDPTIAYEYFVVLKYSGVGVPDGCVRYSTVGVEGSIQFDDVRCRVERQLNPGASDRFVFVIPGSVSGPITMSVWASPWYGDESGVFRDPSDRSDRDDYLELDPTDNTQVLELPLMANK